MSCVLGSPIKGKPLVLNIIALDQSPRALLALENAEKKVKVNALRYFSQTLIDP